MIFVRIVVLICVLGITGKANAICLMGLGDTCPISDQQAEAFIRPRVDGVLLGNYGLPLRVLGHVVPHNQSQSLSATREGFRSGIAFISSDQPCGGLTRGGPGTPSLTEECEYGRLLMRRQVMSLEISERQEVFGVAFSVVAKLTPHGEAQLKGVLRRSEAHESIRPTLWVATHRLRLLRVVRSRSESAAGQVATFVEFEYEIAPNIWAHIEKKLLADGLPTERRLGTAIFQKWSDGWRLVGMPDF